MEIKVRKYNPNDVCEAIEIWNKVVDDGVAFPQLDLLTETTGNDFFLNQTYTAVAYDTSTNQIVGLYILHPNNVGRCGHICNCSYAVKSEIRGNHIGEMLVKHSLDMAKSLGFKIMQFNAVVKSNKIALHIYEKLGFVQLGTIPNGFLLKNGTYEDIILWYHVL